MRSRWPPVSWPRISAILAMAKMSTSWAWLAVVSRCCSACSSWPLVAAGGRTGGRPGPRRPSGAAAARTRRGSCGRREPRRTTSSHSSSASVASFPPAASAARTISFRLGNGASVRRLAAQFEARSLVELAVDHHHVRGKALEGLAGFGAAAALRRRQCRSRLSAARHAARQTPRGDTTSTRRRWVPGTVAAGEPDADPFRSAAPSLRARSASGPWPWWGGCPGNR